MMAYKKITRRKLNTKYTKRKPKNNGKPLTILKILKYSILAFIIISISLFGFLYVKYIKDLPSISELENLEIAESSIIYDRNGKELYKIFKEKRTYVDYEEINPNMINALVSGEDKRFWTNPGVDLIGITRAGLYYLLGKSEGGIKGTSTLTQQLIRNTIIKNERSIERKVKEIYLAYKLTKGVSKEKIIELYLNKISFGHNAFGIEEAAKTFFAKSAKDVNILESSILASLPKGPTFYSPYNHPTRTLGYLYFFQDKENIEDNTKIITQKDTVLYKDKVQKFKDLISNMKGNPINGTNKIVICGINKENYKKNYNVDNDGCLVLEYPDLLNFLNNIQIADGDNYIEYQTGRKDFILGRMLEDGYINFQEYKEAVINSLGYKFNQPRENIKAAHFIFYVKEYLEEKYGKEIVSVGGLKIYTTLDLDKQEKAEEIVQKYSKINSSKFGAKNAALVSIDNRNGDIVAMVGGNDYFDKENKGNVNIITSKLQPGSTFKPFVYSMGIYKNEIGTKSPIYDVETVFPGSYSPANFDGKFMGKMDISSALNNSRNIPAIKMIYLAGGEKAVVAFMKKLGVDSLKNHGRYGAPLALGTGEMTPLELAGAYSVFANMGEKVSINPILKIVDTKGNIIEEKIEIEKEEVISPGQSYITNNILSDTTSRPDYWNKFLSLNGRKVAAKTGTSTKQYERGGKKEIFPRNLWTAGYTPQYTTIAWAGNTDGKELNLKGNGLDGAGPIFKEYMEYTHKGESALQWKKPNSVKEINVSEITGLLPNPEGYNNNFITKSLFLNKPTAYDNSYRTIRVDTLCNGVVTNNTPKAAIKEVVLLEFHSLYPNNPKWENPVQEWAFSKEAKDKYGSISNVVTTVNNKECVRSDIPSEILINSNIENDGEYHVGENYIELGFKSNNPIQKVDILINGRVSKEIPFTNKSKGVYTGNFFIPVSYKNSKIDIEIRAVDNQYYSTSTTKSIYINPKDEDKPVIRMINPIDSSIKIYDKDFFNLKAEITDKSSISKTTLILDGNIFRDLGKEIRIDTPINKTTKLELGMHSLVLETIDSKGNKSIEKIRVEVLEK